MIRLAPLIVLLALAGVSAQPAEIRVRLHHVHYAVGDPSAAMSDVVQRTGGTRTIVPGFGVGVGLDEEYLLFDRLGDEPERAWGDLPTAYRRAVEQLQKAGLVVDEASPRGVLGPDAAPAVPFTHIAFAAEELTPAADRLARAGGRVVRRSEDAVLFALAEGRIELVRDTTRPDAFWCPMHPDVRSADPGKCGLCSMDLVPIPPPRIGEYRLDVTLHAAPGRQGLSGLTFTVRPPDSDQMVTRFETVHERTFHLFIISRDLSYFAHVHPEAAPDGRFVLTHRLRPGEYMLVADFLPEGGTSQMVQRAIIAPGTRKEAPQRVVDPTMRRAVEKGLAVTLEAAEARAGKEVLLTFSLSDAKTGAPVTDLQPYLGAPAHMLIVRSDLGDAIHAHPEEQATSGPTVSFHPLIPTEGDYRLWIQFQRGGEVITVPFALRAGR